MASVVLTGRAKEDVRDLDGAERKIVLKALKKLEEEPEKRGAPLGSRNTGSLTGLRKLVVGDRQYRVVYRVETDGEVVVVWVVGTRTDGECYDMAMARLKRYREQPELAKELEGLLADAYGR